MMSLPLLVGSFVAGFLMFLAPCTLPIVPGYLAFIAGGSDRGRVLRNALAFVIGFSAVFVLFGASAGLVGVVIGPWRYWVARAGGLLIVLFGLALLGVFRLPLLSGERHVRLPSFLVLGHASSSALIGVIFALGWSPCIGPLLGSVLFIASVHATALPGALLLLVFSLGLGIPFLLTALMLERAAAVFAKAGGVLRAGSIIGGAALVLIGLLMLLDKTAYITSWGLSHFVGYDALLKYF